MTTDAPREDIFFIEHLGFIMADNPYRALELRPDTLHEELLARLPEEGWSREILASPARRLAWHLLERPEKAPSRSDHVRALFDVSARRSIVASLLYEAIAGQYEERCPRWEERWEIAEVMWAKLLRHRGTRRWLITTAKRLELPAPEETVNAVIDAAEALLSELYAIYALSGDPDRQSFYGDRLRHQVCSPVWFTYEEHLNAAAVSHGVARYTSALRHYVDASALEARDRGWLASKMTDVLMSALEDIEHKQADVSGSLLDAAEAAARVAPHEPRLLAALSDLYIRHGVARVNELHFDEGGLSFAKAAALDPSNELPTSLLENAALMLANMGAQAMAGAPFDERTYDHLRMELCKGMRSATAFAESGHGGFSMAHHGESIKPSAERVSLNVDRRIAIAEKGLRAACSGVPPASSNQTQIHAWLFSALNPLPKLAAVAGVAILLASGGVAVRRSFDDWRRDLAYARLEAAEGREQKVLAAARDFLAHDDEADTRRWRVLRDFENALDRELSRAAREGDIQALEALLREAELLDAEVQKP